MKVVACGVVADCTELQCPKGNEGMVFWAEVNRLGVMKGWLVGPMDGMPVVNCWDWPKVLALAWEKRLWNGVV